MKTKLHSCWNKKSSHIKRNADTHRVHSTHYKANNFVSTEWTSTLHGYQKTQRAATHQGQACKQTTSRFFSQFSIPALHVLFSCCWHVSSVSHKSLTSAQLACVLHTNCNHPSVSTECQLIHTLTIHVCARACAHMHVRIFTRAHALAFYHIVISSYIYIYIHTHIHTHT